MTLWFWSSTILIVIMGWRIIEINTNDFLKLYLNNLLIKKGTKKLFININDIDILILDNYQTTLSVQLINQLVKNNAIIITFDSRHEPTGYICAVKGNHASLKILEKQLAWTNIYKGNIWQKIVQNKIYNQEQTLHINTIKHEQDKYSELIASVGKFDITNREGHAAKIYWHSLFGLKFKRSYDAIANPILNSMLNYGYAILRSLVIKSIIKKGLDCRISIFHKSVSNFFALASDLMEPFRPIIDNVVYKHRHTNLFTPEIKVELIESINSKININGKKEFVNNAIDKCVNNLIMGKGWLWVDIWK